MAPVMVGTFLADDAVADPLNSNDAPPDAVAAAARAPHDEFNLVPVGGGTSDIGIGGGYFLGLARMAPGHVPYAWNVESAGFVTFAKDPAGGIIVPYQDDYITFTVPRFLRSPMELEIRPEFSWESTLGYYGLGNASSAVVPPGRNANYFEYGRLHPEVYVQLRSPLVDHVIARGGIRYTRSWLQVRADSKLAEDLRSGSPAVKALLGSTAPNGVALFGYGIQFDNRDNVTSSHRGTFDSFDLQVSPGGASWQPYRYLEATADLRVFVSLGTPRIVLAGRLASDLLVGDPPFYELARFENTYAIGGLNGVRGVPAERYYGKVKVLGNAELRTEIITFHAFGKPVTFGLTGFFDGGRVWADTSPRPELDGRGPNPIGGLKYGVGAGVRFQSGSAFVLRGDVAWSPDAMPLGGYVAAGQMF